MANFLLLLHTPNLIQRLSRLCFMPPVGRPVQVDQIMFKAIPEHVCLQLWAYWFPLSMTMLTSLKLEERETHPRPPKPLKAPHRPWGTWTSVSEPPSLFCRESSVSACALLCRCVFSPLINFACCFLLLLIFPCLLILHLAEETNPFKTPRW